MGSGRYMLPVKESDVRRVRRDVLVLLLPAVLLVSAHLLIPISSHSRLAFSYTNPQLLTAWSAAVLHVGWLHLLNTTSAYLVAIGVAYLLATVATRRRLFWSAIAGIGCVVPPVTVAVDYWLLSVQWNIVAPTATAVGFSAVVSAVAGLLTVFMGLVVTSEYGLCGAILIVGVTLLCGGSGALVGSGLLSAMTGGLIIFSSIAIVGGWWTRQSSPHRRSQYNTRSETDLLIIFSCLVVMILLGSIFQIHVEDGQFSNVIAHATGYSVGIIWTGLAAVIDDSLELSQ